MKKPPQIAIIVHHRRQTQVPPSSTPQTGAVEIVLHGVKFPRCALTGTRFGAPALSSALSCLGGCWPESETRAVRSARVRTADPPRSPAQSRASSPQTKDPDYFCLDSTSRHDPVFQEWIPPKPKIRKSNEMLDSACGFLARGLAVVCGDRGRDRRG